MRRTLPPLLLAAATIASACHSTPAAASRLQSTMEPAMVTNPPEYDVEEARRRLREFGARYDYDMSYLELLLELSPVAHATFAAAMALPEHRGPLPVEVHFVARIAAMLADDCGACTQLNLRLAVEAGVDRHLLQRLLAQPAALPPLLALVYDHTRRVVGGDNADAATVAELRRQLGDAGFAALCVTIVGCRIYPGLKRALGQENACRLPALDF